MKGNIPVNASIPITIYHKTSSDYASNIPTTIVTAIIKIYR